MAKVMQTVVDCTTGAVTQVEVDDTRPPALQAWAPLDIVLALEKLDVAAAIADSVDKVTWTKFCCATAVREDNPLLLAALKSVGKSIDELKKAMG